MPTIPAALIYINAFPGAGKLTIAKGLQPLLPGSRIPPNHDLIDPVEKHWSRRSAHYRAQHQEYRQQRQRPICEDPGLQGRVFVFTDSQTEYSECVSDYTDLCLGSASGGVGRRLYSVVLECEVEDNVRRVGLPGRGGGENGKLRECRRRGGVLRFGDGVEIVLDLMDLKPEKAARRIGESVLKREREGRSEVGWGEPDYDV